MSDDLVKMARLAQRDERMSTGALYGDLADRIEELEAERDKYHGLFVFWRAEADKLREQLRATESQLAKSMEALEWCSGSSDFNDGGIARNGWLKLCAPILYAELKGEK